MYINTWENCADNAIKTCKIKTKSSCKNSSKQKTDLKDFHSL